VLEGDESKAAPRDNVVFEAGYFAAAKGRDRVLIIREYGAKMPADLGGNIYLSLPDRNDTRLIESSIRDFVNRRL
jgi:predicted nucleotide-binding protein